MLTLQINTTWILSSAILMKLLKFEEKNSKANRKIVVLYKGMTIRITVDFSADTL
jgi:hypothetical protein